MKKTLLVLFTLQLMASQLFAQTNLINENFSSGSGSTPPTGWTNFQLYTTVPATDFWFFNNPGSRTTYAPFSGAFAIFDSDNYSNNAVFENIALVSPVFNTLGINTVNLLLDYQFGGAPATGYIEVFNGSTWVVVQTITGATGTTATSLNLDVSDQVRNLCNAQLRFRWSSNSGGYWAIDNVKVQYNGTPNTTNARLYSVSKPIVGGCGNSAMLFEVVVKNEGTTAIGGFPVKVSVFNGTSTTTVSATAPANISPCSTVTVTFTNPVNMGNASLTYTITAYTELSGDQQKNNSDTLYMNNFNVSPAPLPPSNQSILICGTDSRKVGVALNSGDQSFWYSTSTTQSPFYTGDSINTANYSFNGDTTVYVETFRATQGSLPTTWSAPSTAAYPAGNPTGLWINITAQADMIIDSFGLLFRDPINTTGTGKLFYKTGTYAGFETNTAAWTNVGSVSITSRGGATLAILKLGGIRVSANQTISVYIHTSMSLEFRQGGFNASNSDMSANANNIHLGTEFVMTQNLANFSFPGAIYYKKPCVSNRASVLLNFESRPASRLQKGAVFNGTYTSNNTYYTPDHLKARDTVDYELVPPLGYTNSQFGSAWYIAAFSFNTPQGITPASDTVTVIPTPSSNGRIRFRPTTNLIDTTFELMLKIGFANGCDSTIYRYIYVAPTPEAGFSNSLTCKGQTIQFTDSSKVLKGALAYNWNFGDPSNSTSNLKNPQFTYSSVGTYNVKLIVTSELGYRDSLTKQIIVHPTPVSNFSYGNSCIGDSTLFTNKSTIASGGSITSYEWTFGNNTSSGVVSPKTLYNQAQGYNVWLVAQSNNGCRDSIMKVVYVFPRPVADFSTGNICKGSQATFTNNSTISSGILGYNWIFGDGNSAHDLNPQHAYNTVGNYTVKLKVYSAVGCLDSISKSVTVADKPIAGFTVANTCDNDSVSFTDATNFAGTGMTQTWSFGDGNTTNKVGSVKHFYNNHGTYTATLTATAGNCSDSKTVEIDVKEAPQALFASAGNICVNTPFSFSNTSDEPTGATTTYLWNFGNSTTSTQKNASATYTTSGSFNVTLVATSSNNCTDTEMKSYTVYDLPVISFDTNYLSGLRQVQFVPSNTTYYNYEWNMDDGNISNQISPVYTFLSNGPFNVKLKVADNNGCMNNATSRIVGFNVSNGKEMISGNAFNVFPNPFKGSTNINFTLTRNAQVKVTVYDMLGKELGTLLNDELSSGNHSTLLNSNLLKSHAGMYLIKVEVDGEAYTKQVVQVN